MKSSSYQGVGVKMCESVCLYVCLSLLVVIVKSEDTETFIRQLCKTSQELWKQNHNFLLCGQMLSEVIVKLKKWLDQIDRNSSISHVGISSFLIACGRLGIRPSDVDKQMIASFPKTVSPSCGLGYANLVECPMLRCFIPEDGKDPS